jgi:polyferredoxin
MDYPRGLIRFATQNGLAQRWNRSQTLARVLRPRVLVYGAVLLLIGAGFVTSLALRSPFKVDVVRDRGVLARPVGEGQVENVYRLQVMNATEAVQRYRVRVEGLAGAALATRADVEVGPAQARWLPVSVQIPADTVRSLGPGAHAMRFEIERLAGGAEAAAIVREKSTFVVPR